jgi:O-antigen/teichoic acid export membrane protein
LFKKEFLKEFFNVSLFGFLNSFSGVLALNIDIIMISTMIGLSSTGIYTVTFFFGSMIIIPSRSLLKISSVIIADAWKANDLKMIRDIYRKSSITLTTIGMLILIGIWGNIDNVFHMIKPEYEAGKYVILFIGLAYMMDLLNGMARPIIFNSKYYKLSSAYLFGYLGLLLTFNFILIPVFGILGAALATFLSKTIHNLVLYLHIYLKHNIDIFSYHHLLILLVAIFAYSLSTLMPALEHFILDIMVRSALISVLYILPTYWLKISPDINNNMKNLVGKLVKRS